MSVSILRNGKLWGLFACHHMRPLHVSYERRSAAELFGQMFALLLESPLRVIEKGTPAFAILDVNLGNESSFPIADRLIALGVPIVFATGYGKNIDFPERFANVPVVSKPYTDESLAPKVAEALARADVTKA